MGYLIDTDIIIYSLKKYPLVQAQFQKKSNIPKFISVITYGELIFGARKSAQVDKNLTVVYRIAEIFPVIEVGKAVVETFGNLKASLQAKGRSLSDMDLLIGATALTMNYCLVTNNERHFSVIPGLEIENWAK